MVRLATLLTSTVISVSGCAGLGNVADTYKAVLSSVASAQLAAEPSRRRALRSTAIVTSGRKTGMASTVAKESIEAVSVTTSVRAAETSSCAIVTAQPAGVAAAEPDPASAQVRAPAAVRVTPP